MNWHYLPNTITCFRIVLIVPVLWGLFTADYPLALCFFILAGCSDGLDGFLARHYGWTSRLGSMLDPIADKLLLMSSFVALTWLGYISYWLFWVVVARDLWIVSGAFAYHYVIGEPEFTPSWMSKLNTLFQILLIVVLLLHLSFDVFSSRLLEGIMYLVCATSVFSLIDYTWVWGRRAIQSKRERANRLIS